TANAAEFIGITDRVALAEASNIMKNRINENHLRNGVSIIDASNTYIGPLVTIEQDVMVKPGTTIRGKTPMAEDAVIGPHSEVVNCTVGKSSIVRQSTIYHSTVGEQVDVGPLAHLRPESVIGNEVRIGNFVEIKKSTIDEHSKLPHLSYLGDATLGYNINIG